MLLLLVLVVVLVVLLLLFGVVLVIIGNVKPDKLLAFLCCNFELFIVEKLPILLLLLEISESSIR